jgi:hypothetical protein
MAGTLDLPLVRQVQSVRETEMTARPRMPLVPALVVLLAAAPHRAAPADTPGAPAPSANRLPVPIRIVDPPIADTLRGRCGPGHSVVRIRIDRRGLVVSSQLARPFPVTSCVDSADARRIDELAVAVTRQWAFLPAITAGQPQSMVVEMPIYVPTDTLFVPRHEGTIIGQVVDAERGRPVPITRVELDGSALTTRTDRNGYFRFDHLVRLRAAVIAGRMGFLPDTAIADVVPGRVDTLRLRLPVNPVAIPDSSGVGR